MASAQNKSEIDPCGAYNLHLISAYAKRVWQRETIPYSGFLLRGSNICDAVKSLPEKYLLFKYLRKLLNF